MGKATCSVEDCTRIVHSGGLCELHCRRFRKFGTTELPPAPTLEERFWAKVDKTETCWLWTASTNGGGYGEIRKPNSRKAAMAHRLSYEWAYGPIPPKLYIDHICRNPPCVRPDHLRVVTQSQNNQNVADPRSNNKSGYRNVCWSKEMRRWDVSVHKDGKTYLGGYYADLDEAGQAAKDLRLRLFTHNDADRTTVG